MAGYRACDLFDADPFRDRFGLRVLGFCLMGKHIHLAVEQGATKLACSLEESGSQLASL